MYVIGEVMMAVVSVVILSEMDIHLIQPKLNVIPVLIVTGNQIITVFIVRTPVLERVLNKRNVIAVQIVFGNLMNIVIIARLHL